MTANLRMGLVRACIAIMPAVGLSACESAERANAGDAVVDTLLGGRVLVSSPDRGRHDEGGGLRLVEELRIGDMLGEGPGALGNVVSVAVDRQGNFFVADQLAKAVLVFDSEGTFLRSFGREGEGPGEFRWRRLGSVGIAWQSPGRLWIVEPPWLAVMDADGSPLAASFGGLDRSGGAPPKVDQGGFAYYGHRAPWKPGEPFNLAAFGIASIAKYAISDSAEVTHVESLELDPPPTVILPEAPSVDTRARTAVISMRILPMQPELLWTVGPDGNAWIAHTSEYRIHEVAFSGDTLRTVELQREPDPLAGAERDSLAEAQGFDPDELPAFRLMFDRIDVSPDGYLWVHRRLPNLTFAWDIFDPCGRFEGTVVPETRLGWRDPFFVAEGGVLIGVARDAMELEYVVRMRLQRPEGAPQPAPC